MQYDEDIAFQRAILANPADTTLKLVYADWLQERDDLRAGYIRHQLELPRLEDAVNALAPYALPSAPLQAQHERQTEVRKLAAAREKLAEMGRSIDPAWIGFMNSLAQSFEPLTFQRGEPGHPFTEAVGLRGRVVTFNSKYRSAEDWSEELLTDLAFLTGVEWDGCAYGAASADMYGFLCELPTDHDPLTARDVLATIKAADFQSEHIADLGATTIPYPGYHPYTVNDEIHSEFAEQYMFDHDQPGAEDNGKHGALKRYVTGKLWYVLLHTGGRPCAMVTLLAVGRSPHGKRLVGATTSQVCHNLCD